MKTAFRYSVIGVFAMTLFLTSFGASAAYSAPTPAPLSEDKQVVDISGTGYVEVAPDVALVSLEVVSKGKTAKESLSKNKKKIEQMRSKLVDAGVPSEDVVAGTVSTYSDTVYSDSGKGGASTTGYSASQSIRVVVKKEELIADVADLLVEKGVTRIDSIYLDTKEISFSIDATGKTAKEAMEAMNATVQVVKDGLAGLGVSLKKDFYVSAYSLYPTYDYYSTSSSEAKEFTATQTVTVKVRGDTNRASDIADVAVDGGADRINSISYSVDDYKEYQKKARRNALQEAREKALDLAELNGLKLGRVAWISESSYAPYPVEGTYYGPSLSPGLIRVEVSLIVQYFATPVKETSAKK